MAGGMALGMTVALTIYACTTKTDFTVCGSLFFCMSVGLFFLAIISLFMRHNKWWHPIVAVIFIIAYGLYLIYDTQLIAGNKSHKLSMEDYVVGALLLYIDIMMIFLELLKLFGSK